VGYSRAAGINTAGQVVGSSYAAPYTTRAFLYSGGVMTDLNTLLPAGSGWVLQSANAINDHGQIVGQGTHNGQTHAFLLTLTDTKQTTTTVTGPTTSTYGQQVTFTATVSAAGATPTGSVQFQIDGSDFGAPVTLSNGIATISTSLLAAGDHSVVAFYTSSDTSQFEDSDSSDTPLTLTVNPITLAVTTPTSEQPSGPTFGPYLPGVPLNVTFTVSATDPGHAIQSVRWEIGGIGGSSGSGSPAGPGTWTFPFDVGNLNTATHSLTITAFDSSGNEIGPPSVTPYTAELDANPQLSLALTGQIGAGSAKDVNDLRFIHSTDPRLAVNETFKGEVVGLPDYYTHSSVAITLSGATIPGVTIESTDGNLGFEFDQNAETLPARTSPVGVKVGNQDLSRFGADPQPLVAVDLPPWLSTGTPSFTAADETYHFANVRLPLVQLSVPLAPIDTGVPWLDAQLHDLTTFADLTATVAVTIPLDVNQTPTVDTTGDHLDAQATVLGQPVWQHSYDTSMLRSGGTLDPLTLQASSTFVRLAAPIDLGSQVLINKTFSATFPVVPPLASARATLAVQLVGDLTIDAGIQLGLENNVWVLQPEDSSGDPATFVTLTATASAHVEVDLDVVVGIGFITQSVNVATAFIDATLTLEGTATFSGSLTGPPSIASTSLQATLEGNYGFTFIGDLLNENDGTDDPVDEEGSPDFSIVLFRV
jgi:probable HAF family extracellular repeat protein